MNGRWGRIAASLAVWLAAAFGLWVWAGQRRDARGEIAVMRLRAFHFGAGRQTRLEGSMTDLQRARGRARFETDGSLLGVGPMQVRLFFGPAPAGTFEVEGDAVRAVDETARALAEELQRVPPSPHAPPAVSDSRE